MTNGEYVSFGGDATYAVPDTLRFLATINNDFTTENLSPRLLDRASIVTLPETDAPFIPDPLRHDREPISWKALTQYFGARSNSPHAGDIEPLLDEIYEAFKTLGIVVSMRTRLAVGEYVSAEFYENRPEKSEKLLVLPLKHGKNQIILKVYNKFDDHTQFGIIPLDEWNVYYMDCGKYNTGVERLHRIGIKAADRHSSMVPMSLENIRIEL